MVKLLDFGAEGPGISPWLGHGDSALVQGTLHMLVPLHSRVHISTNTSGGGNLQQADILFRRVEILWSRLVPQKSEISKSHMGHWAQRNDYLLVLIRHIGH